MGGNQICQTKVQTFLAALSRLKKTTPINIHRSWKVTASWISHTTSSCLYFWISQAAGLSVAWPLPRCSHLPGHAVAEGWAPVGPKKLSPFEKRKSSYGFLGFVTQALCTQASLTASEPSSNFSLLLAARPLRPIAAEAPQWLVWVWLHVATIMQKICNSSGAPTRLQLKG